MWSTTIAAALCSAVPLVAQPSDEFQRRMDTAERRIVRLQPSAFPELPARVATELKRRGCTIPQEAFSKKRSNVIQGEFARSGQTDWAVLCSRNGTSSILVFWAGSAAGTADLAPLPDRNFLQGITATEIGYSRGIRPAGKDFILRHYDVYGGIKPPPLDHVGIDDAFIEKGSIVHYFHAGKWLRLTGSD